MCKRPARFQDNFCLKVLLPSPLDCRQLRHGRREKFPVFTFRAESMGFCQTIAGISLVQKCVTRFQKMNAPELACWQALCVENGQDVQSRSSNGSFSTCWCRFFFL